MPSLSDRIRSGPGMRCREGVEAVHEFYERGEIKKEKRKVGEWSLRFVRRIKIAN